jgi:hypothetical protein
MKAVSLTVSEMPRLIPAGSIIELEPVGELKFGDIVYADRKDRKVLCRFLRSWLSNGELMVMLAQPGQSSAIALPMKSLVGKVARVSFEGNVKEPNKESFLFRLLPRLTDYGTKKPF